MVTSGGNERPNLRKESLSEIAADKEFRDHLRSQKISYHSEQAQRERRKFRPAPPRYYPPARRSRFDGDGGEILGDILYFLFVAWWAWIFD